MNSISVRIDPANAGHFFACCGLFELASARAPYALSRFSLDEKRPRFGSYVIDGISEVEMRHELDVLAKARCGASFDDPTMDKILPVTVTFDGGTRELNWWLRPFRDAEVKALKCWGGNATGEIIVRELVMLLEIPTDFSAVFDVAKPTSKRFGVDPRSAWNPLDFGQSPNDQGLGKRVLSFPNVEMLAAVGLQGFRPTIGRRRLVPYFLWTESLHKNTARTAAFHPWPGLDGQSMEFSIEGRGQSYKYFSYGKRAGEAANQEVLKNVDSKKDEED